MYASPRVTRSPISRVEAHRAGSRGRRRPAGLPRPRCPASAGHHAGNSVVELHPVPPRPATACSPARSTSLAWFALRYHSLEHNSRLLQSSLWDSAAPALNRRSPPVGLPRRPACPNENRSAGTRLRRRKLRVRKWCNRLRGQLALAHGPDRHAADRDRAAAGENAAAASLLFVLLTEHQTT